MKSLPADVEAYKATPEFTEATLPAGLRKRHTTAAGVWARIVVLEGSLHYRILVPELEEVLLDTERVGVVEPGVPHEVEPAGSVRFYVEFMRVPTSMISQ